MTLFRSAHREAVGLGGLNNPGNPLTGAKLLEWFKAGDMANDSGVPVTPTGSLAMSAVYRCVALIAGLGGELPLVAYTKGTFDPIKVNTPGARLLAAPCPGKTPSHFWRTLYCHRALWGNSYAQIIRNRVGFPIELWPIRPDRVTPGQATPNDLNPSGRVYEVLGDDGDRRDWTSREVFHVPHLGFDGVAGVSPISLAKQAIGMGLAAEAHAAKLFGSGNLLSGFIKTEGRLKQDQAETLQERWRDKVLGKKNAHDIAVLDSGAEFQSLTMPNDDAQFLESRHFQVPEIGRWFGVPPFLLYETEKSTSWGTGLEQQSIGFSTYDLGPQWLTPTEQAVSMDLLTGPQEARYRRERLLRGDSAARGGYYAFMRQWAGLTANEARAMEGLPPIEGGDVPLQPLNMGVLGEPPEPEPEPPPALPSPAPAPDPDDPDE